MNHWLIAPILLPLFSGALLVLFSRRGLGFQRVLSFAATMALLPIALQLFTQTFTGAIQAYLLGDWPAPFGITLVLDRLSALMLVLTAVLALFSLLQAMQGTDSEDPHFHTLFQFQLLGLNGAFLTGDLFNLFVFFEVLLLSSYGLLMHGTRGERTKAGLHYVVINLTGSFLFLIAAGLLYGATGTLNLVDMAQRVSGASGEQVPLIHTGALLLLVVFGLKAAILPLHFWLPGAYTAASLPVAALFAIMTKVGVYAIVRVFMLVFGPEAGELANLAVPWLLPAAIATTLLGGIGLLAASDLRGLIAYLVILSVGTLLLGIGLFTVEGLRGALYYLPHTTLVTAGLFLLAQSIGQERGPTGTTLIPGARPRRPLALGTFFLLGTVAAVGMPPLSGFIGKVFILRAAEASGWAPFLWSTILITGVAGLVAASRSGSTLFWNTTSESLSSQRPLPLAPAVMLLLGSPLLVIFATPVSEFADATARQLIQPQSYIKSVLGSNAPPSNRPQGDEFR